MFTSSTFPFDFAPNASIAVVIESQLMAAAIDPHG